MVWAVKLAGGGAAANSGSAKRSTGRRDTLHSILIPQTLMKTLFLIAAAGGMLAAQSPYLSDLHQLTPGGQNAEAYWSPDGKRLTFQSTRRPYESDPEFIMNADGSDQPPASTGKRTTPCGCLLP